MDGNLPPEEDWPDYYGLVRQIARSIVVNNPGVVSNDDLLQAGALAVVLAFKSYDPSQGSFNAYIRKSIKNALLEQANSFSAVFTTDDKVRRQANTAARLAKEGKTHKEIMCQLGIRQEATLLSLLNLVESKQQQIVDVPEDDDTQDVEVFLSNIELLSDELKLTEEELDFVDLSLRGYSMREIENTLRFSTAQLYKIRSSVYDKFTDWIKD
jgi:RNA polymerase sigma factor (sigma-70 family)